MPPPLKTHWPRTGRNGHYKNQQISHPNPDAPCSYCPQEGLAVQCIRIDIRKPSNGQECVAAK
jgi:hypothetical protein